MRIRIYTVCGYYRDCKAPWSEHAPADTVHNACVRAVASVLKFNGKGFNPDDLIITHVFVGKLTNQFNGIPATESAATYFNRTEGPK